MLRQKYEVGKCYKYSELPQYAANEISIYEYGAFSVGKNVIHVESIEADIWFVLDAYSKQGIYKCIHIS